MKMHDPEFRSRFWGRVVKDCLVSLARPDLGPCWIWSGAKTTGGYGNIYVDGFYIRTHRVSYEISRGSIGRGLQIDHLCRVPQCVNPSHLEAVTQRENMLRGYGPAALNARRDECIAGHKFPRRVAGRRRICLICVKRRNEEFRRNKKWKES